MKHVLPEQESKDQVGRNDGRTRVQLPEPGGARLPGSVNSPAAFHKD